MNLFDRIADNRKQYSLAAKMRQRRFKLFLNLLATVPRPVKILDVGGTERFWEVMEFTDFPDVEITLLNRFKMVPNLF